MRAHRRIARALTARLHAEGYARVTVRVSRDRVRGGWTCTVRRGVVQTAHGWGWGRSQSAAVRAAFRGRVPT